MNPFEQLAQALAPYVGGSVEIAGYILGAALTVTLLIAIEWAIEGVGGRNARGGNTEAVFFISAGIGTLLSVLFGWFPPWTVLFIVILVVLIIVKPFGSAGGPIG